jgi:hypothetical protein
VLYKKKKKPCTVLRARQTHVGRQQWTCNTFAIWRTHVLCSGPDSASKGRDVVLCALLLFRLAYSNVPFPRTSVRVLCTSQSFAKTTVGRCTPPAAEDVLCLKRGRTRLPATDLSILRHTVLLRCIINFLSYYYRAVQLPCFGRTQFPSALSRSSGPFAAPGVNPSRHRRSLHVFPIRSRFDRETAEFARARCRPVPESVSVCRVHSA